MFLLSSAIKNEDFIFKKQQEPQEFQKKISTKELLCGNINSINCDSIIRDIVLKKNKEENDIIDNN